MVQRRCTTSAGRLHTNTHTHGWKTHLSRAQVAQQLLAIRLIEWPVGGNKLRAKLWRLGVTRFCSPTICPSSKPGKSGRHSQPPPENQRVSLLNFLMKKKNIRTKKNKCIKKNQLHSEPLAISHLRTCVVLINMWCGCLSSQLHY